MTSFVVAIDGPAGSGKSTTARRVAERLGFLYLDTGAMYRAVTWSILQAGIDPQNVSEIERHLETLRLDLRREEGTLRVALDDQDVTQAIRSPEVSRQVSFVARVGAVRRFLVRMQREIGGRGEVVVEGRDIGTVVFPEAAVKIYLDASIVERARRRREELRLQGEELPLEQIQREIELRDALDSRREDSPLRRAPDAELLDTTGLSVEDQVDAVVARVLSRRSP